MNAAAPSGDLNVAKNSDTDIFGGEAGVVKALSTLRQAAIPPKDKDSLRNLFLTYAGESDNTKRSAIKEQIIEQIGKNPQLSSLIVNNGGGQTKTETKPQSNSNSLIGQTRPTPSFVMSKESSAPAKVVLTPEPTPSTQAVPTTAPAPEVIAEKVVPATAVPTAVPEKILEQTPAPQPPTQLEVKEVAPTPPTPAPVAPVTTTDVRARIDTIKHDINGRVGNPVNVINADEAIGREYMSALLDAMKRSSTGGGAESLPRLETAYKATLDLIIEKGLGQPSQTPSETKTTETETKTPELSATPPAEVTTPKVTVPEPTPAPQPPISSPEPEPITKKISSTPQQSEGLYHRPSDEIEAVANPDNTKLSSFASKFFKSPQPKKQAEEEKSVGREAPKTEVKKVEVKPQAESKVTTPPTPTQSDKLQPLQNASATLPEKMAAIKSASAKREEEAKKPITDLKSPEVEAGLRQLLSEWVLFKKSGFLGTGPSGIDHPLYKQLAGMPMAAVVSGRFEGVTPEIKRRLSDYMTGWRYEQGVMHEMGETFENYLRRVIRQVLERQRAQANKES